MTHDIGIVLLPNDECKNFALHMTQEAAKALPTYKQAPNNPHITLIHIANLDEQQVIKITDRFNNFYHKSSNYCIQLPITGIKATGGAHDKGYKWLDLQFETLPPLSKLRQAAVETFCPFHNGTLTRMHDDMENFTPLQREEIAKCGVTFSNYLPHISTWYIDLPNEKPTIELQNIAKSIPIEKDLQCYVKSIALVELGRNGNAIKIINDQDLCDLENTNSVSHRDLTKEGEL